MTDQPRVLTCVYCGMAYPQDTPAWGDQVLTEHIKACEKHPMRQAEEKIKKLRTALIGLVGAEDDETLDQMEVFIRVSKNVPDVDKANTINAITALRETKER